MSAPIEQFLDEFRGFEAAATPGPWGSARDLAGVYTVQARPRVIPGVGMGSDGDVAVVCPAGSDAETYANARFIAMARTAAGALLEQVDRQAREIERLTAELAKYVGHEPTLAEEAQYRHEAQVRYAAALEAQICQCEPQCEGGEYLHAADCPVVPIQMQAFDAAGGAA